MLSTRLKIKLKPKGLVLFIEGGQKEIINFTLAIFVTSHSSSYFPRQSCQGKQPWPSSLQPTLRVPSPEWQKQILRPSLGHPPWQSCLRTPPKHLGPRALHLHPRGGPAKAWVGLPVTLCGQGLASPPISYVSKGSGEGGLSVLQEQKSADPRQRCLWGPSAPLPWCVQELTDRFGSNCSVIPGCTGIMGCIKIRDQKMELITFYQ